MTDTPTDEMRERAKAVLAPFFDTGDIAMPPRVKPLFECVAQALTEARREGAEAMRERAAQSLPSTEMFNRAYIRALPLTDTGKEDEGIEIIVGRSLEEDLASVDAAFARLKGETDNG
jgi:hypothetical protein